MKSNQLTCVNSSKYGETVSICFEFGGKEEDFLTVRCGQYRESIAQDLRLLADAIEIKGQV